MSHHTDLSISMAELSPGAVALVFVGELGETSAAIAEHHLAETTGGDDAPRELVLDMAGLTFIDSAGLSTLVRHRRSLGDDTTVVIQDPNDNLRRLLELTALDALFPIRYAATA